jgi:glyoxylase-like metal-dependent hydrolase (beta-lactamase superfamily II)
MAAAAIVLGLGAVLVAAAAWQSWQGETAPRPTLAVRAGSKGEAIWGVWAGHSYVYVLEAGAEVVLVGSGSDGRAEAVRALLAKRGFGPQDVRTVVLTHGDYTQTAGLAAFDNAIVWAGGADGMLARRDVLPKPPLARLQARLLRQAVLPKPRVQALLPGQRLPIGTQVGKIVALPGYTPGSVALVVGDFAFVGDALVGGLDQPELAGWPNAQSPRTIRRALGRLGRYSFTHTVTNRAGVLPWGRDRLCAWLVDQGARAGAGEAVFTAGCTATTAGSG